MRIEIILEGDKSLPTGLIATKTIGYSYQIEAPNLTRATARELIRLLEENSKDILCKDEGIASRDIRTIDIRVR